jgi:FtsH-binding integral membrane protein
MSLISLVVALIVVGILLWLVNAYIPMDGKIKSILNALVILAVVVGLLNAFGVFTAFDVRVPQVGVR